MPVARARHGVLGSPVLRRAPVTARVGRRVGPFTTSIMRKRFDYRSVLSESALFGGLPEAAISDLAAVVRPVVVTSGKTLFRRGDAVDGCYAIIEGSLKVTIGGEDGPETLLAVLGPGDVVGEMGLIDRQPRSATIKALKPSRLGHIRVLDFERLADANTSIYRHLLAVLAQRLRAANEAYSMQQMPLKARLAHVLLRLSEGFGETLPDGRVLIRQRLSQLDLGRMSGAARENVNRQINAWKREAVLTRLSGYYCVQCMETLRGCVERQGN